MALSRQRRGDLGDTEVARAGHPPAPRCHNIPGAQSEVTPPGSPIPALPRSTDPSNPIPAAAPTRAVPAGVPGCSPPPVHKPCWPFHQYFLTSWANSKQKLLLRHISGASCGQSTFKRQSSWELSSPGPGPPGPRRRPPSAHGGSQARQIYFNGPDGRGWNLSKCPWSGFRL